jgi:hypothetical protein
MNNLEFLQDWYKSQCNGDWEHNHGIKIETLDNPGWYINIDLEDTEFENIIVNEEEEISDTNWFFITVKEKQLIVFCDINKLIFMLEKIKNILSHNSPTLAK